MGRIRNDAPYCSVFWLCRQAVVNRPSGPRLCPEPNNAITAGTVCCQGYIGQISRGARPPFLTQKRRSRGWRRSVRSESGHSWYPMFDVPHRALRFW